MGMSEEMDALREQADTEYPDVRYEQRCETVPVDTGNGEVLMDRPVIDGLVPPDVCGLKYEFDEGAQQLRLVCTNCGATVASTGATVNYNTSDLYAENKRQELAALLTLNAFSV
jgi:hypothetical protein